MAPVRNCRVTGRLTDFSGGPHCGPITVPVEQGGEVCPSDIFITLWLRCLLNALFYLKVSDHLNLSPFNLDMFCRLLKPFKYLLYTHVTIWT